VDAKTLFNDKVPNVLAEHPEKAREINAVYFFKITGDGGGEWTVDLKSNPPTCKPGSGADAKDALLLGGACDDRPRYDARQRLFALGVPPWDVERAGQSERWFLATVRKWRHLRRLTHGSPSTRRTS